MPPASPRKGPLDQLPKKSEAVGDVQSAQTAGVARIQFYRWRDDDPVFQGAMRRMQELMKDRSKQEMFRRAVLGVERAV